MRKTTLFVLMAVSSSTFAAQTCNDAILATAPNSRFMVNGGEVTDYATSLIWQRCSLGQTGADCSGGSAASYTWQEALQAAEQDRAATGTPWRLPNVKELLSVVEEKCFAPAINLTVFPNTPNESYWSGSPYASGNIAWLVDLTDGGSIGSAKWFANYVRLVRGGQ